VILADINDNGLHEQINSLKAALGSTENIECMHLNVTDQENWIRVVEDTLTKWGKVDILVNNAGTSYRNKV
jgi:NADP-dependent 3-hydroxy acid dehydrogenase YdfG